MFGGSSGERPHVVSTNTITFYNKRCRETKRTQNAGELRVMKQETKLTERKFCLTNRDKAGKETEKGGVKKTNHPNSHTPVLKNRKITDGRTTNGLKRM